MKQRSITYIRRSYQPRTLANLRFYDRRRLLNRARAELDFRTRRVLSSSLPFYLTIEPTNICNLSCPLCFAAAKDNRRERGSMRWETYVKALDLFAPWLLKLHLYNAGEPFLHEGIFDMIAYAGRQGIRTQVSTNLTVFGEKQARQTVLSGLDSLVVSIDGASQETYGQYRVGGDFDKVMANLRLLLRTREELRSHTPRILWSFLLFRHNLREQDQARRLARELGVEILTQSAILGGQVPTDCRDPEVVDKWLPAGDGIPRAFDYFANKPFLNPSACHWPWQSLVVLWDGSIAHCCYVNSSIPGLDISRAAGPAELWNARPFRSSRNEFRGRRATGDFEPTVCARCQIFSKPR